MRKLTWVGAWTFLRSTHSNFFQSFSFLWSLQFTEIGSDSAKLPPQKNTWLRRPFEIIHTGVQSSGNVLDIWPVFLPTKTTLFMSGGIGSRVLKLKLGQSKSVTNAPVTPFASVSSVKPLPKRLHLQLMSSNCQEISSKLWKKCQKFHDTAFFLI